MSALDKIHAAVRSALIKDGWTITHDPYTIKYEEKYVYADLAAEHTIAAERENRKIVVEVKSFLGASILQDFKEMLGQYDLYWYLLQETAPEYQLYIAVDNITFTDEFVHPMVQLLLRMKEIPLVVVDLTTETVRTWTK